MACDRFKMIYTDALSGIPVNLAIARTMGNRHGINFLVTTILLSLEDMCPILESTSDRNQALDVKKKISLGHSATHFLWYLRSKFNALKRNKVLQITLKNSGNIKPYFKGWDIFPYLSHLSQYFQKSIFALIESVHFLKNIYWFKLKCI